MDRVPSSLGVMPIVRLATSFGSPNHTCYAFSGDACFVPRVCCSIVTTGCYTKREKGKAAAEYIELERKNADFDTEFSSE